MRTSFKLWLLLLAGAGLLAMSAQAEEKASSVMTALSSTTLSGYVDTSIQWNLGTGDVPAAWVPGANGGTALDVSVVPEPSTLALIGLGAAALVIRRNRHESNFVRNFL
jgi:hypothetical protein